MNDAVKFLSDDALVKVAAYYASARSARRPCRQAPRRRARRIRSLPARPLRRGLFGLSWRHRDQQNTRHAEPRRSGPEISGRARSSAYKTGQRKHGMMKTLVSALSDADDRPTSRFSTRCRSPAEPRPPRRATRRPARPPPPRAPVATATAASAPAPATQASPARTRNTSPAAMQAYKTGTRRTETHEGLAASLDDTADQEPRGVLRRPAAAGAQGQASR